MIQINARNAKEEKEMEPVTMELFSMNYPDSCSALNNTSSIHSLQELTSIVVHTDYALDFHTFYSGGSAETEEIHSH
jgi:hypothetical protein